MTCNGCGNAYAYRWKKYEDGTELCDRCGYAGTVGLPDVFWDGGAEHGLPDDPRTGQPMTFGSKAEKARYLRLHDLVEAGDKIRGSFPSVLREAPQRDNPRDAAQAALRHVQAMGADRRRQEFHRILKESER